MLLHDVLFLIFLYKLVNPVLYFSVVHNIIVDALLYKRHI